MSNNVDKNSGDAKADAIATVVLLVTVIAFAVFWIGNQSF